VRSLRRQRRRATIKLRAWDVDVADEVGANFDAYAGKTLVIDRVCLDPTRDLSIGKEVSRFPLRGGGMVVMQTRAVPAWLRQWTGAPLKLRAALHPPRRGEERSRTAGPILRGLAIDFSHPLELAYIQTERAADGTWLTAHIENYRDETAAATVKVRFAAVRHTSKVGPLAPGETAKVRLKLFGALVPRWTELAPEARSLRLVFGDGSASAVDLGMWLDEPPETLLDWGYGFKPPGNAVLALSADRPEAELERFAGLELRSYLRQFTDANIEPREPDATEALPAQPLLVVGTARHNPLAAKLIREAGLEARIRDVGPEGYVLKSLRHAGRPTLLVTGLTPRGLVHGVYGLLEQYGVRFTMGGGRLPARRAFRVLDVDASGVPRFARRRLVAAGPEPMWTSRWSHWQWISMIDVAASNRFNEVVMPLDGLESTLTYKPGVSRGALFPFQTGPYSCVAEAYLDHQRGLGVLVGYARRRGLDISFARWSPEGKLSSVAPPACVAAATPPAPIGRLIELLDDPGDFIGLPRLEETAKAANELLRAKSSVLSVPYRGGARIRASFLAKLAWDKELTPGAFCRRWAATLGEGDTVKLLADAALGIDRLDGDLLAACPRPFGAGAPLALPVAEGDLACNWTELRARASKQAVTSQIERLKAQSQKLREVQRKLEPIHATFREAFGSVATPWEDPLFEDVLVTRRAERASRRIYMLRALVGALASVQEGALAYYGGLREPAEALPRLRVASSKCKKARRIVLWVARTARGSDLEPTLLALGARLRGQAELLAQWLGPANEAEPVVRLDLQGSDAIVHLFRTANAYIYGAYKLSGRQVVQLRLNTEEARLFRRGQAPRTIRATGGAFLVELDTVPTYIVARRAGAVMGMFDL